MSRIAIFCALFVGLFAASAFTETSAAPSDDSEVVEPAPVVVQGSNAALMPRKDESGKIIGTPSKIASLPGPMWRAEVELTEGCDWVASNNFQQVRAALHNVVGQQLNTVQAHQPKQRVVSLLKFGLAVFQFHRGKFALQDLYKKVTASTSWFQEARINAFGLFLHQVQHGLDHPRVGKEFSVVCDSLFGSH